MVLVEWVLQTKMKQKNEIIQVFLYTEIMILIWLCGYVCIYLDWLNEFILNCYWYCSWYAYCWIRKKKTNAKHGMNGPADLAEYFKISAIFFQNNCEICQNECFNSAPDNLRIIAVSLQTFHKNQLRAVPNYSKITAHFLTRLFQNDRARIPK